jgi:hypothetical protein
MFKKGLSLMVSYVLLIVIAVGLSILVFAFLKLYVPPESPHCPDDVSLIVTEKKCDTSAGELEITFQNKGLFSVNAVYVRLGEEGRKVKSLVNENVYFSDPSLVNQELKPGDQTTETYSSLTLITPDKVILEIEPAILQDDGTLALCEKAVITQSIVCEPPAP